MTLPATTEPSTPAFSAIWRSDWSALRTMAMPVGLVEVDAGEARELLGGLHEGHAAADDNAFLHGRAGRVQRVVDAVLAFLRLTSEARRRG